MGAVGTASLGMINNQINIISATPSTTATTQTGRRDKSPSLNYVGSSDTSYYYYPKICARHRVPSVN